MDHPIEDCLNCKHMNKELNLLQRRISLLNLELDELKSSIVPSCPTLISQGCQTEMEIVENDSEAELTSSSSIVSSISCLNLSHDKLNVFRFDEENQELIEPCNIINGHPFIDVDICKLDESTSYTKKFNNRLVAYYGDFPYKYEGAIHQSNPISSNKDLLKILDKVKSVLPDFDFNSVLITKYPNGNYYMPYHSDNEDSISEDSCIATISLGQSRMVKFRPISSEKESELLVNLSHGQVYIMTKKSQKYFEHSIPKDYSRQPRISITLRLLHPQENISTQEVCDVLLGLDKSQSEISQTQTSNISSSDNAAHSSHGSSRIVNAAVNLNSEPANVIQPHTQQKSITLYISSSMFRYLDEKRLCSASQDSFVFFYPGASAGQMLTRFKNDPRVKNINLSAVKNIMLMTGTNNVEWIAGDPTGETFNHTINDICNMISYLNVLVPTATINPINVLPRKSYHRNVAVNQINKFLYDYSKQHNNINFVNTEAERCLFTTKQGYRKSFYFVPDSNTIYDNCHLNHSGISRLAKHLKYVAHNNL